MVSPESLQGSLPQQQDIKSSENLTSPTKTAHVDQSNEPADIVGGVSTDHDTMDNSKFPSPSSFIKKSMTISNCPTPRRTILGRTSVSKSVQNL